MNVRETFGRKGVTMQQNLKQRLMIWLIMGLFIATPGLSFGKDGPQNKEKAAHPGRAPKDGDRGPGHKGPKGEKIDKEKLFRQAKPQEGKGHPPDVGAGRGAGRRPLHSPDGDPKGGRLGMVPPGPEDPAARAERRRIHLERIRKRAAALSKSPKHKAAMSSAKKKDSDIAKEQRKHLRRMARLHRLIRLASEQGDRNLTGEIRDLQKQEMKRHAAVMREKIQKKGEPKPEQTKDPKEGQVAQQ
jgi:hypothetical protein